MSDQRFVIRRASVDEVIDLRHVVLRHGLPRESATFELDGAPESVHAAAWADGQVVGCATFVRNPLDGLPAWQLRGMAVATGWRKAGVGRALLVWLEDRVADHPVRLLWCNARTPAVPFYERQGWRTISDEFHIATAGPHYRMRKEMRNDQ